eukprot:49236_1
MSSSSSNINPRNQALIGEPHTWSISDLNGKNKPALIAMLRVHGIDFLETDTLDVLLTLLKDLRLQKIRENKNSILRANAEKKRQKKKKNQKKRTNAASRNRCDPIMKPIDDVPMTFERDDFDFMQRNIEESNAENEESNAEDNEESNAQSNEDNEESVMEFLQRIGCTTEEIQVIEKEEFEAIQDVLDLSMDELKEMGGCFKKMGRRKAMKRRIDDARKSSGDDSNNVVNTAVVPNVNDVESNKKVWIKVGNRKCYIGKIKDEWIWQYRYLVTRLIFLLGTITDASVLRQAVFSQTRSGYNDKVRCFYQETTEPHWPHSNIECVKDILKYLVKLGFVVLFDECDGGAKFGGSKGWTARFGRVPVSTVIANQLNLAERKKIVNWMDDMKANAKIDWEKYCKNTSDDLALSMNFHEGISKVDWDRVEAWRNSLDESTLRQAKDPHT